MNKLAIIIVSLVLVVGLVGCNPPEETAPIIESEPVEIAPELISPHNGAIDIELTPVLLWAEVPNAKGYEVLVSRNYDFSDIVHSVSTGITAYWIADDLLPSTQYYWMAAAKLTGGGWSPVWTFTTASASQISLNAPELISPHNGATGIELTPVLLWNEVPNAKGYELWLSQDYEFSNIIHSVSLGGTAYQVRDGLNPSTRYYWMVIAKLNRADPDTPVACSPVWTFTTGTVEVATSKPSRPPLRIGETMYSHDFAFTPTEVGYTSILITGPFIGNTFYAFEPIEDYKFFYLKMIVRNQGIERASPPMYGGDAEFKVKVDKGYIYQEINQIASLSWADEERCIGQVDPDHKYPCSNHLIFDLNPEDQEELVLAFEILEDTHPVEISFRLFASPEFISEYGIETIIIPLSGG